MRDILISTGVCVACLLLARLLETVREGRHRVVRPNSFGVARL